MSSQLDTVIRTKQIDFKSLHIGFRGWEIEFVGGGVEYIIAVVYAGVQGAEIKTAEVGEAGCKGGGLGAPG